MLLINKKSKTWLEMHFTTMRFTYFRTMTFAKTDILKQNNLDPLLINMKYSYQLTHE